MLTVFPETVTIEEPFASPTILSVSLFDDGEIVVEVFEIFLNTTEFNDVFAILSALSIRASTFVP